VYRREDLYRGPLRHRAPDILLELRHAPVRTPAGYTGPSIRSLAPRELDGERGAGLNGAHRPEGILLIRGPGFPGSGRLEGVWIGDLAPTLLARLGVTLPTWMQGRPLHVLKAEPRWKESEAPRPARLEPTGMTREEERRLERRLRALGYLG
jgi:hypothetical protein